MLHEFSLSGEEGRLSIGGSLTIENAVTLRTVIADALGDSTRLVLDLSRALTVDLSALQLLCSAHRTAVREGKTLILGTVGEECVRGIETAGLSRHPGCLHVGAHRCLWNG